MFEEYTEKDRRVTFFARYEASVLGSGYVEPQHLLLGLVREDKSLSAKFVGRSAELESIRKQVVDAAHPADKVPTSIDVPLSDASRAVLARAEKERVHMRVPNLDTGHLLLGLLQEESLAAEILRERKVKIESVREQFENPVPSRTAKPTACKDCKHLVVDGEPDPTRLNLFCAASPREPTFDCFTGEVKHGDQPGDRYQAICGVGLAAPATARGRIHRRGRDSLGTRSAG